MINARSFFAALGVCAALTAPAAAQDIGPAGHRVAGRVAAHVVRVIDADSIRVCALIWVDTWTCTTVRVAGIDTPEIGWRADCDAEREKGDRAARTVRDLLPPGTPVDLTTIAGGKFGRRFIAAVILPGGESLGDLLIEKGLARAYDGRGARQGWCNADEGG